MSNNKENSNNNERGEYNIINCHCHIFPEKIEKKAVLSIGEFYNISMDHNGNVNALINDISQIKTDRCVVCSTATTKNQVKSINDFISDECQKHSEFIGFGTLHPDLEDIKEEIERIIHLNLKGIKLHPDFQLFNIDDQKAMDIYKYAEGRLPILFHTGDDRYDYSNPTRLANILKKFPDLIAIGAHFGGYQQWDISINTLKNFKNAYIDTSSSLFILEKEKAVEMIRDFGVDRTLFGTDFPMWDSKEELARFMALPLTKDEQEKILHKNAEKLFKL